MITKAWYNNGKKWLFCRKELDITNNNTGNLKSSTPYFAFPLFNVMIIDKDV